MADFESALAQLQKATTKDQTSVYDALVKVVGQVLDSKAENAVDLLETTLLSKKTTFKPKDTPVTPVIAPTAVDSSTATSMMSLYSVPVPPVNAETGEPEELEPPNDYEMENLMSHCSMFESIGAGFGATEAYNLMLAAKSLGENPALKLATVRLFGKFYGTKSDYYVFETTLKEPSAEEASVAEGEVPAEVGVGTNAYTYFVTSGAGSAAVKLPDVTPAQIVVSKSIKKYFTGDLSAEVSAYPPFPGTEANYLRAIIARIASQTVLCPSGFFSLGEDGSTLDKAEDYTPADASTVADAANWCHRYPYILEQGRCTFWAPPPTEGAEEGEDAGPEPEVPPPLLGAASEDPEVSGAAAWAPCKSSALSSVKYQVAGVRSLLWPGAYSVAAGGVFSNVYVGYGVMNAPFVPLPPPAIAEEYAAELVESVELPARTDLEPEEEEGEGEAAPAE